MPKEVTLKHITYESVKDRCNALFCQQLFSNTNWSVQKQESSLRIDDLLIIEHLLWKSPRNTLKEILIHSLIVPSEDYKRKLAMRMSEKYLDLTHAHVFNDRENHLSILHLTVQLFTVPSIASSLVSSSFLISVILSILKASYMGDGFPKDVTNKDFKSSVMAAMAVQHDHYPPIVFKSDNAGEVFKKYKHLFMDLKYLLSSPSVRSSIFRFAASPRTMEKIVDICSVWQRIHTQTRQSEVHVEYEGDIWIFAFNLCFQLGKIIRLVGQCFSFTGSDQDPPVLIEALKKLFFAA